MSLEEKQAIVEANETLIERFEREASEAATDSEEYTALGLLHMVSQNYEQLKSSW